MVSKIESPSAIASIFLISTGVLLCVIGIILLIIYQNQHKGIWLWIILIAGILFGVAGGIWLSIILASCDKSTNLCEEPCIIPCEEGCVEECED